MVLRCPHCNRICLLLEFYKEHQILHELQRKREAEGQKERGDPEGQKERGDPEGQKERGDKAESQQKKREKNAGAPLKSTKSGNCAPVVQIIVQSEKECAGNVKERNPVVENEVDPLAIEHPGAKDNNNLETISNQYDVHTISSTENPGAPNDSLKSTQSYITHLKCKHCQGIFFSFSKLLSHCFSHILLQQCAQCKETYTNVGEYAVHMLTHDISEHGKDFIYHRCRKCSSYFCCRSILQRHIKWCHVDGGPLKCGLCKFEVPRIMPYQNHVLTHIGKTICICHICGLLFEEEEALRKHISQHAPTMQCSVFQCFNCGICFTEKLKLLYHVYRLHNGLEPHFCELCSQIYYHGKRLGHNCLGRQQQNTLPVS